MQVNLLLVRLGNFPSSLAYYFPLYQIENPSQSPSPCPKKYSVVLFLSKHEALHTLGCKAKPELSYLQKTMTCTSSVVLHVNPAGSSVPWARS